jgi:hypothetical protein
VVRSCGILLTSLVVLAAPATAFANCPATMAATARLNCLNSALNAAVTEIGTLQSTNTALRARVDVLEAEAIPHLSDYLSVRRATDSVVFSGANVYVESGSGATDGAVNGLGNLVIGYGEDATHWGEPASDRTGSHNLVVGSANSYTSFGGLVVGFHNAASYDYASVVGGFDNVASGYAGVVCGGAINTANGAAASVSGGYGNTSSGYFTSVSGGGYNEANENYSAVSGGYGNDASGEYSSVSGGSLNVADGGYSSVSGGYLNLADGAYSAILGGDAVTMSTMYGTSP